MTFFNWDDCLKTALKNQIRYATTQAKASHPDLNNQHPDEVRDANLESPTFTKLKVRITKEHDIKVDQYKRRRAKLVR